MPQKPTRSPFAPMAFLLMVWCAHCAEPFFNVTLPPFRAAGDGRKNDRPALQAALDSAARKGGTVFLPPGTYLVDAVSEPDRRVFCLLIASNVKLMGAGRGASVIKLADNQPNETRILTNAHYSDNTGDSIITFEDFSIDGNAGRQKALCSFGIRCIFTRKVLHNRILIKDIKGTPTAEGAFFESYSSSHNSYSDCEAVQTLPGDTLTGSGFSVTYATGIEYRGCRASGSSSWQGFTAFHSRLITYTGCHAYSNKQRGFNCERSSEVQYSNCIAGGRTALHKEAFPYAPNTSLGNVDGFYVWNSENVLISNCIATGNHRGINNFQSRNLNVVGGIYSDNNYGICVEKRDYARFTRISGGPIIKASRKKALSIEGLEVDSLDGTLIAPAIPPSDSVLINPYPFDVSVSLQGGPVQAVSIGKRKWSVYSGGSFRVPAGAAMRIRYAKPPEWEWEPE